MSRSAPQRGRSPAERLHKRKSFTLVELLLTISIIALLASTALFALYNVVEHAKEVRTRAQISKLHELVMDKWEGYRTRAVRLNVPPALRNDSQLRAMARLCAIRDLMRMELPDRISDVADAPANIPLISSNGTVQTTIQLALPSKTRRFRRSATSSWSTTYQGAECLYQIVAAMREGDDNALEFFQKSELGDIDEDGMPEIWDGWGRPIEFLRWAPGYSVTEGSDGQWGIANTDDDGANGTDDIGERAAPGSDDLQLSELQIPNSTVAPDPFDPVQVDDDLRRLLNLPTRQTFALTPLIFSAGPDGVYDIVTDLSPAINYRTTQPPVDPFLVLPPGNPGEPEKQFGMPWDVSGSEGGGSDGKSGHLDNINNHWLGSNGP